MDHYHRERPAPLWSTGIEKKLTFRDIIVLLSISAVGLLVLLSMYMVDRQWRMMAQMRASMAEQADDIRGLRLALGQLQARGVGIARNLPTADGPAIDGVFARADEVAGKPDYAEGDWLVSAFPVGLKTISPLVSSDVYASNVQDYVLESLLVRSPQTLEWEGMLADEWQVSEDGLTIEFRLRDNLTFSDGEPLTADDVAFTFEFTMDDRIAAPRHRASLEKISQVSVIDDQRVRFEFREAYFEALGLAGQMKILPRHFYERYLDDAEAFNQSRGLLLGSGPYRLTDPESWRPDEGRVELVRNQRYWGSVQPPYNRIVWSVIENDSARLAAFRNGSVDSYSSKPREYKKLLADAQISQKTEHHEYMSPTAGYSYIGWNSERDGLPTRFADGRVRLAMTLLTDRQRIVDELMLGYAEIAVSPFNPRSPQHNPQLQPRTPDLDKAKDLLTQAGYADRDGDGVLENEAGEPFEFELVYFQDSDDTRRIVLFLKDLYARAGVLLVPKPTEWSVMIDLLNNRNFDAITLGWSSGVETDIFQMFHGSQTEGGGDNFVNFRNAELDRLIDEARSTVDEAARMQLWWQAEAILHAEQPYTFLMRRKTLQFIDKRIQNVAETKLGLNLVHVPVVTYVPSALQKYQQ